MTEAGTVTPWAVLSLESAMTRPPAGAALEIVSEPEAAFPPTTVSGAIVSLLTVGALTYRTADALFDVQVEVMVALTLAAMAVVLTVKDAEVCPAAMETEAGTVTPCDVLSLESAMVKPPTGAALDMVSAPAAEVPPTTLNGVMVSLFMNGPLT